MTTQRPCVAILLTVALGVAGCTDSGSAPPASSSTARTSSSSTAASPRPVNAMLMSVTDPARSTVTLYRIDENRHATKLQVVAKPAWANVVDGVQQDGGSSPPLCVVFSAFDPAADFRHESWCYPAGTQTGSELQLDGRMATAFSADGRSLLAMSDTADETRELTVNRLDGRAVTTEHTVNLKDQRNGGCDVESVAWAGGPNITVQCPGFENDWPVWVEQNLAALTSGAVPGDGTELTPAGPLAQGYNAFSQVTPIDANTAIALLQINEKCGEYYGTVCPDHPRPKAVRVDLHTGRVLEVVSVAASDRNLTAVSGGSHGLVYLTEGGPKQDKRVYVRWPGEKHGTLVTGLPGTLEDVVAQH